MTRAPKPPRHVWVRFNEYYGSVLGPAGLNLETTRAMLCDGERVLRYDLAPIPKRKRGKR